MPTREVYPRTPGMDARGAGAKASQRASGRGLNSPVLQSDLGVFGEGSPLRILLQVATVGFCLLFSVQDHGRAGTFLGHPKGAIVTVFILFHFMS